MPCKELLRSEAVKVWEEVSKRKQSALAGQRVQAALLRQVQPGGGTPRRVGSGVAGRATAGRPPVA